MERILGIILGVAFLFLIGRAGRLFGQCPEPEPEAEPQHLTGQGGGPPCVSPHAKPSDTGHYIGYYVGGGTPFRCRGDYNGPEDGTWGWDYHGCLLPSKVFQYWFHCRPCQPGRGGYKTDGPHILPEHKHEDEESH